MHKEIRAFEIEDLEVRQAEAGPMIRGYAAVFDKLSLPLGGFREKIRQGAFRWSLEHKKRILALWNHDSSLPIGSTDGGQLRLEEDSKGLYFELVPIDTNTGRDVREMVKSGVVKGVSFGFFVKGDEWDDKAGIRTLTDVDLVEISPTPFPAYPATTIAARSAEDVYRSHLAEAQERQAGADMPTDDGVQAQLELLRMQIEIERLKNT